MDSQNIPSQPQPKETVTFNPKPTPYLPYILGGIFLIFVVAGGYYLGKLSNKSIITPIPTRSQQKACTMEAKICPDGSTVGKTGLNCEFAPCPINSVNPLAADESLKNPDTNCVEDKNCVLINRNLGYDCCQTNNCQPIDYSLASWIGVNKKWYDKKFDENCSSKQMCPMCMPRNTDINYSATCVEKTCVKTSLVNNKKGTECGGWNILGEFICECSGKLIKPTCPPNAACDGAAYTCEGVCSKCCYKGIVEGVRYPKCTE